MSSDLTFITNESGETLRDRFRTEDTQSYELLAQICRGKRVVLVSATPLNNAPAAPSAAAW